MSERVPHMPAIFVGHGSPMNALGGDYAETWRALGASLPRPKAILCVSAHWYVEETAITAMSQPRTIHDFYGFPKPLYDIRYPAPGDDWLVERVTDLLAPVPVRHDHDWGLDHGAWSVLIQMFPKADIPVYQLSLDLSKNLADHFKLAQELRALREKGVLIIGSGNVVHNLRMLSMDGRTPDWSVEFDRYMADAIATKDAGKVLDIGSLGRVAQLAHPSIEHFLPVLYPLAVMAKDENVSFFNEGFDLGSISMRSFLLS